MIGDGFRWERVQWETPTDPVSRVCSYCGHIAEPPVLRITRDDGWCAQFCGECQALILADEGEP